jgi:hypothetical protein
MYHSFDAFLQLYLIVKYCFTNVKKLVDNMHLYHGVPSHTQPYSYQSHIVKDNIFLRRQSKYIDSFPKTNRTHTYHREITNTTSVQKSAITVPFYINTSAVVVYPTLSLPTLGYSLLRPFSWPVMASYSQMTG